MPHTAGPEHQARDHLEREPPRVSMWWTEMTVRVCTRQSGPGPQEGTGEGPSVRRRLGMRPQSHPGVMS